LLRAFVTDNDQDAFAVVVTRHAPLVWGVCRRILGHRQDAEDAFQATFLILARRAGSARWQASVGGWLYTVAHRLAVRARKHTERRRACERAASLTLPAESSLCELAAVVDEELRRLPAKYRDPLLLHYLEGATAEAAARQLDLSRGTFYNRLNRGRELLRGRLTRQGLSLAAPLLAAALTHEAEAASPSLIQAALRGTTESVPARVATLAVEALRNTLLTKLKIGLALGLLLGMAAGGVAMLTPRAPMAPLPQAEHPAEPPKAEDKVAMRVDRYGDPLPPGAVARLGTIRFRAPGEIMSLAYSPDGKTIAVASHGGLFLFDAASGKRLRQLSLPNAMWDREMPLAFSPDGKRLARRTGKQDGQRYKDVVFVWELAGNGKPREYDAECAMWIGWSSDGEPQAVCLEKDAFCLRNLASGSSKRFECKEFHQPEFYFWIACACAPAGKTLAIADEQCRVHIWDTAAGRQRCALSFKNAYIHALAFSHDGRILASLVRDQAAQPHWRVQLWDARTGAALHTLATDQENLRSIVFAPDGKTLVTVSVTEIRLWDAKTGRERCRPKGGGRSFGSAIAFSPDGKTLATTEAHSGVIHLWDVPSGTRTLESEGHTNWPGRPSFSFDGKRVATGSAMEGTIFIWDVATGEPCIRIHRSSGGLGHCAFSADGRTLYSCSGNQLLFFDAANGQELHVQKVEEPDRPKTRPSGLSLYLSDDHARLIVVSTLDNREMLVTGWDVATRKQLFQRRRPWMDLGYALSADGRVLAAPHPTPDRVKGGAGGPVRLEDTATGELLLTLPALEGQTWPLAFSPDGRLHAAVNSTGKRNDKKDDPTGATGSALRLWETATATEVLALSLESQFRIAFSPDGQLLALTAPGGDILLWDLRRGKESHRFKGFDAQVTSLAFSPDGSRLVSGLNDTTLLVWDVAAVRSKDRPAALDAESVRQVWDDLSADARKAFAARWTLAAAPEQAVPLLRERLKPAQAADREHLRRLLAELDSEQFTVREKARQELAELGELAEPALRQALADKPSLEARRQIQTLLDNLRAVVTQPEQLRALRAVAVLEDMGTPEARRVLEQLAKGTAEARLTREVKASLRRLDLRTTPSR
jgi:RNA polymerase sigma factor (sigma-70 family)